MFRSIRWTTQLWYAAILALSLATFGLALDVSVRRKQARELDSELERAAHALASRIDRAVFDGRERGRGDGPDEGEARGRRDGGGPGRRDEGAPGRRDEGAPGRRDEGAPGRRDEGAPGRRDDGDPDRHDDRHGPRPDAPPDERGDRPPGAFDSRPPWARDNPGAVRSRLASVPPDALERVGADEDEQLYFVIWAYDGTVGSASSPALDVPPPDAAVLAARNGGPHDPPHFRDRGPAREVTLSGPVGTRVLVGSSRRRERAELGRLHEIVALAGACILAVGLLGGWLLAGRVLRPIEVMSAAASAISATDLSRRIDVREAESELGSLARTLNEAFARLESAFDRQVRFTADASHELRTPLSVVHSHAQIALSRPRTAEEYRQTIETCLRATTRMKSLVESLLMLARADAHRLELVRERCDLALVVQECVTLLQPLAAERAVTLETELASLVVLGDRARLAQVVTNLVGNAIRYNKDGGKVRVTLVASGLEAVLSTSDTGIGIPLADQPRVFERFFRADPARSRDGGTGLGLAICSSIVAAHGGAISFESKPGEGTTFVVRLPLARAPEPG